MNMMRMPIVTTILLSIAVLGVFGTVVFQNSESRNIVFSFCAVVGAIVMFLLTLFFELRSTTQHHVLHTQVSIFHDRPAVTQCYYPVSSGGRLGLDKKASDWLAKHNPEKFKHDSQRVMRDFTLYSLIGFFLCEEMDWQKKSKTYVSISLSAFRVKEKQKGDDTFISKDKLKKVLTAARNVFSVVPYDAVVNGIFLPPSTRISLINDSLTLENPHCILSFHLDDSASIWYGKLGSSVADAEKMPDGTPKHETRYINVNITAIYKGSRAKSREMPIYKDWVERVVSSARKWFEINKEPHIKKQLGML